MIIAKLPYAFVVQQLPVTWQEVLYGLQHQLIKPEVAIDMAVDRLHAGVSASEDELELAGKTSAEPVVELVSRLAATESALPVERIRAKWVYRLLAWLFENRTAVPDPLAVVEEIYADFHYPPEVAPFVRSMPMKGPDLGSWKENERRMYQYWRDYLEAERRALR